MGSCFVIQPFDGGPFDARYKEVLCPAIIEAGLKPYRVDQDTTCSDLMASIENGIRSAEACVADISEDNPNVWFELGFALALRKPVVLICKKDRGKFPFDVQHRPIIAYSGQSEQSIRSKVNTDSVFI